MTLPGVIVGKVWEAVGPFPTGMREHHLTASPLHAFQDDSAIDPDIFFAHKPYDKKENWPSEIAPGGQAGWRTFEVGNDGWLEVFYPDIRWSQLRSDHGWAALQYQSILRTTLAIPSIPSHETTPTLIDLVQGVEFALVPSSSNATSDSQAPLKWFTGDIYDFANTPTGQKDLHSSTSNFARALAVVPGEYILLVRAIYEIRMFGDPLDQPPTIRLKVVVEVDQNDSDDLQQGAIIIPGTAIMPDLLDGWFMGDWLSVAIRVPANPDEKQLVIIGVENDLASSVTLILDQPARIGSGQTRPITLRVSQQNALASCIKSLAVKFKTSYGGKEKTFIWHPTLKQHSLETGGPLRMTFIPSISRSSPSPSSSIPARVAQAMLVPPPSDIPHDNALLSPVLLALHGAGVDYSGQKPTDSMPKLPVYWAVLPEGGNEWGEDWHGGSMAEVWAAREAANHLLQRRGVTISDKTILMGHSNGGQGAWHLAARYPDRIVGLIIAAGWLNIQHYVPYTENTSNHYADPALMGILQSSLTPYQNDLYASNLVGIPILVIHGAEDDNVPPRHSRAHLALIASWAGSSDNLQYVEVPKEGHWWDDIFHLEEVTDFISKLPERKSWDEQRNEGFTIGTANPQESGGRAGLRIVELDTPGRLARLDVNARQWRGDVPARPLDLRGTNIKRIEFTPSPQSETQSRTKQQGDWRSSLPHPMKPPRAYGPMIRLLATSGLIHIIVPSSASAQHASIARRIAHDLYVYHRLDSELVPDQEAIERLARDELGEGAVVVIGRPDENVFADWTIKQKQIPLSFPTKGVMLLDDKVIYDKGAGIITLHPHPTSPDALAVLIAGNDEIGLELAARLFPIRTGVPIPDWAVVSPRSRWQAAGGLIGAGFWSGEWGWNESMSWVDR